MYEIRQGRLTVTFFVLAAAIAGCVSTDGGPTGASRDGASASESRARPERAKGFPRITLDTAAYPTFGLAMRHVGETFGGGVALLAGVEEWATPEVTLSDAVYVDGIRRLVAGHDCRVQVTPHYVFVYPPGYEALEGWSLDSRVDPGFNETTASFAIGAGTDLYNALALLGDSLDTTVVADNAVAEAWCGEVFLEDAPLPAIVEALLKSARIPPATVDVASTGEYILLRSAENPNRQPPCLNREELTAGQRQTLDRVTSLRLPRASSGMVFQSGAVSLSAIAGDIGSQLGVPVTVAPSMADLPVNVAIFNDVTVETALNLVVWQWPVASFGYRISDEGVHFTPR